VLQLRAFAENLADLRRSRQRLHQVCDARHAAAVLRGHASGIPEHAIALCRDDARRRRCLSTRRAPSRSKQRRQGHGKVGSCWSEFQVFEDPPVVAGVVAERAGDVGGSVEA
jgi:hypothetical protein